MSRTVHHRDGSKTVYFDNGNKAHFGPPRQRREEKAPKVSGTPYVFASGSKIPLPSGIAHGMIFEKRSKLYVALRYEGTDKQGRTVQVNYGQPITLTRPL